MPQDYDSDHVEGEISKLPRPDLREPAFRRYEDYIARAALQPRLVIQPWEFPASKNRQVKSAHVFVCRCQDARTGFQRYGYTSRKIPAGFDVSNLRFAELVDGSVVIENLMFGSNAPSPIKSSAHQELRWLAAKIKNGEIKSKSSIPIRMVEDSFKEDMDFIDSLQAEGSEFYGHFVTSPKPQNGILWILMD